MESTFAATLLIRLVIGRLRSLAFIVTLRISSSPNHLWDIIGKLSTTMASWVPKRRERFVQRNTPCAANAAFFTPGSRYSSSSCFLSLLLLFLSLLFFTTPRKAGEIISSVNAFWPFALGSLSTRRTPAVSCRPFVSLRVVRPHYTHLDARKPFCHRWQSFCNRYW